MNSAPAPEPVDDLRLIRQLRAGDERAFTAFFNDYFPRLYRFVLPRAGHDAGTAEELCQQVLSRAMTRLTSYRGEASLFTWLCQIARNEIADYWRRRGRESGHLQQFEDEADLRAVLESIAGPESQQPEAIQTRRELLRLVQVALDHLPTHYASALEWQYLDGLSVQEIAERLGQSLIAAQSVLARARRAFRDAFTSLSALPLEELIDRGAPSRAAGALP
jgi:RNA polymerase sigma-70 factor (ECF subfamily)